MRPQLQRDKNAKNNSKLSRHWVCCLLFKLCKTNYSILHFVLTSHPLSRATLHVFEKQRMSYPIMQCRWIKNINSCYLSHPPHGFRDCNISLVLRLPSNSILFWIFNGVCKVLPLNHLMNRLVNLRSIYKILQPSLSYHKESIPCCSAGPTLIFYAATLFCRLLCIV